MKFGRGLDARKQASKQPNQDCPPILVVTKRAPAGRVVDCLSEGRDLVEYGEWRSRTQGPVSSGRKGSEGSRRFARCLFFRYRQERRQQQCDLVLIFFWRGAFQVRHAGIMACAPFEVDEWRRTEHGRVQSSTPLLCTLQVERHGRALNAYNRKYCIAFNGISVSVSIVPSSKMDGSVSAACAGSLASIQRGPVSAAAAAHCAGLHSLPLSP